MTRPAALHAHVFAVRLALPHAVLPRVGPTATCRAARVQLLCLDAGACFLCLRGTTLLRQVIPKTVMPLANATSLGATEQVRLRITFIAPSLRNPDEHAGMADHLIPLPPSCHGRVWLLLTAPAPEW